MAAALRVHGAIDNRRDAEDENWKNSAVTA